MHENARASQVAALPADPDGHFRLHVYAVVARMLANLQLTAGSVEGADPFDAFPFLAGYRAALHACMPTGLSLADEAAWWDAQLVAWQQSVDGHLPLRALVDDAGLAPDQVRLLVAAGLVEEDIRFGALFAALQEPLIARRPCIGLLNWLLADPQGATGMQAGATAGDAWPACRELLDLGFLIAENRNEPRSEWILRVPPALWDAVRGRPAGRPAPGLNLQAAAGFPQPGELILPPDLSAQVARVPELLASGQVGAVIVRGMQGTGRRTVLGAIGRALGRDILLWEGGTLPTGTPASSAGGGGDGAWRLLGPLATLTGALPVLRLDPAPGEALEPPTFPGYGGPVGITLGRGGGLRGPLVERGLSLVLPPPDRAARARFWQAAGVSFASGAGDEVVDRFLLTGGHIRRTAELACTYAALMSRNLVTAADVRQATGSLNRQVLETLATHLPAAAGWHELVVEEATARELEALEARCRCREVLREQAGPAFDNSLNRGVRALFTGPSGTGKTLAARSLAAALQMDLFRVDLAAVVNKYIGETERNLNQVLSRAEELDVVLLLDEGDALMTRRTEVRNANDRYANLETNYLLQRLEIYEGIVIITTNAGQRIDSAFLRRLDVIVDFTPPGVAERWLIWHAHLPQEHAVSAGFLDEVAVRCALTGGQIRNAALHATLLAGAGRPVGDEQVEAALQREYRKAGAAYPMVPARVDGGHMGRLRKFAAGLG